jgi:hypothetical protein
MIPLSAFRICLNDFGKCENDLFLNGPRIVQIIREIDPIPYDFRERFLKQVRWTFLQKGS